MDNVTRHDLDTNLTELRHLRDVVGKHEPTAHLTGQFDEAIRSLVDLQVDEALTIIRGVRENLTGMLADLERGTRSR